MAAALAVAKVRLGGGEETEFTRRTESTETNGDVGWSSGVRADRARARAAPQRVFLNALLRVVLRLRRSPFVSVTVPSVASVGPRGPASLITIPSDTMALSTGCHSFAGRDDLARRAQRLRKLSVNAAQPAEELARNRSARYPLFPDFSGRIRLARRASLQRRRRLEEDS